MLLLAGEGLAREEFLPSVGVRGFFLGLVGFGGVGKTEDRWKALGEDGRLELPEAKDPIDETLGRMEFGDDRGVVAVLLMGVILP